MKKESLRRHGDIVELLADSSPGLELHGARLDFVGSPGKLVLPRLFDTILREVSVKAEG